MKQKMILNLFLLVYVAATAYGQKIDYNKIILPESATNIRFEEKLVQIAYRNNPNGSSIQKEVTIAQIDYKAARLQWTDHLGVTGNLNEFSIKRFGQTAPIEGNQYFPRYNFFVRLPFSTFVSLPHDKKVAREKTLMAEDKLNAYKLELRARVLKLYSNYQTQETIVKIRRSGAEEEQNIFNAIEERFKKGTVSLDDYLSSQKSNNDSKIAAAQAENLFNQARIDLEEVLGIKMDEIR
jgi:outer membrane protein TolC